MATSKQSDGVEEAITGRDGIGMATKQGLVQIRLLGFRRQAR